MFQSTITAKELLDLARNGADISIDVSDDEMLLWLNSIEQQLYSEIIGEERLVSVTVSTQDSVIGYASLVPGEGEDDIAPRDILCVACGTTELDKVSAGAGRIWHTSERPSWWADSDGIHIHLSDEEGTVQIAYVVRPYPYTVSDISTEYVRMVPEYIPMLVARLRGELYRNANEDALGAKWLSDFNQQLESFKVWADRHLRHFGV